MNKKTCQPRKGNIDLLRCIMSFFVICIHCKFPYKDSVREIIDIAVPVFFLISGFLFYTPDILREKTKIEKMLRSVLLLLIQSTTLYMFWRYFICSICNLDFWQFDFFNFLSCDNPFGAHLWYLHSYFVLLIILLLLNRFKLTISGIPVWIVLLLMISEILLAREGHYGLLYGIKRVFCVAMPFFLIGILINKNKNCIFEKGKCYLYFSGGVICLYNIFVGVYTFSYSWSTVCLAIIMFMALLQMNITDNIFSKIGLRNSLHIYIVHWIIIDIMNNIAKFVPDFSLLNDYMQPILVFVISLICSELYMTMKNRFVCIFKK